MPCPCLLYLFRIYTVSTRKQQKDSIIFLIVQARFHLLRFSTSVKSAPGICPADLFPANAASLPKQMRTMPWMGFRDTRSSPINKETLRTLSRRRNVNPRGYIRQSESQLPDKCFLLENGNPIADDGIKSFESSQILPVNDLLFSIQRILFQIFFSVRFWMRLSTTPFNDIPGRSFTGYRFNSKSPPRGGAAPAPPIRR